MAESNGVKRLKSVVAPWPACAKWFGATSSMRYCGGSVSCEWVCGGEEGGGMYHVPGMESGGERFEGGGGSKMGIETVQVLCPVAVVGIPGGGGAGDVLHDGGDPDLGVLAG